MRAVPSGALIGLTGEAGPAGPPGPGSGGSSPLTRTAVKTANYTAAQWELVPCNTSGGAFTVTLPAASGGKSRVAIKLVTAGNTLTVALTGSDHFNTGTGPTTGTLTLANQGIVAESDGAGIWTVTADDLPLSALDARYVAASTATTKGDIFVATGPNSLARLAVGTDGTVPTADSTDAKGLSYQQPLTASSLTLGQTQGALKRPWGEQAFIGPELWALANMSTGSAGGHTGQNTTLTPSVTGNGTAHSVYTRFNVGLFDGAGQVQETFRFDYTINSSAPSGWAYIAIRGINNSGTITGTEVYLWGAGDGQVSNYRSAIDFTLPPTGATFIEVEVGMANNVPSGTLALSNVSLRQVAAARPSLNVSWFGSSLGPNGHTGYAVCDVPVYDPVTRAMQWVRKQFGNDGQLQVSPMNMTSGQIYANNYVLPSTTSVGAACTSNFMPGGSRNLHVGNDGQIMGVVKGDGSTELRCNTHGGEWGRRVRAVTDGVINGTTTLTSATANFSSADVDAPIALSTGMPTSGLVYISSVTNSTTVVLSQAATATATGVTVGIGNFASNFVFEMDFGDGAWVPLTDGQRTHACRRFRVTCRTEVQRSDAAAPFANVDNTFTVYDDGTVRFDRKITFLAAQQMYQWFYFMHSFDTNVLEPGRLGFGQQVITPGFDTRQYLNTPAAPTAANSSTGGTYGALTRTYSVTAVTPQGETLQSPTVTSTTSSGTTNSFTVTMPSSQSGQTAWGIYDTTGRLAVIPVSQTTWTDTAPTYSTTKAPVASGATVLPGAQQYTRVVSDRADWAAFYDADVSGVVFGTITDRDNALTYPGAVVLTAELDSHPGVMKNYFILMDGTGNLLTSNPADYGTYRQLIPSGTVLQTTAYSFTYAPADRPNWHREIAARGQGFKQFNQVYPST